MGPAWKIPQLSHRVISSGSGFCRHGEGDSFGHFKICLLSLLPNNATLQHNPGALLFFSFLSKEGL